MVIGDIPCPLSSVDDIGTCKTSSGLFYEFLLITGATPAVTTSALMLMLISDLTLHKSKFNNMICYCSHQDLSLSLSLSLLTLTIFTFVV